MVCNAGAQGAQMSEKIIPVTEWLARGRELFGEDPLQWRFKCPICGHVQTMADFKAIGQQAQSAYRECIGRHLPKSQCATDLASVPGKDGKKSPCDYATYGLFQIGDKVTPEGQDKPITVFYFDDGTVRNDR
jgi:hypothetical protein